MSDRTRREWLCVVGAAGVAGIAGCSSSEEPDPTDAASPTETREGTPAVDFLDDFEQDNLDRFTPVQGPLSDWQLEQKISAQSLKGGPTSDDGLAIKYDSERHTWTGNRRVAVDFQADTSLQKKSGGFTLYNSSDNWRVHVPIQINEVRLSNTGDVSYRESVSVDNDDVHTLTATIEDATITVGLDGETVINHDHESSIGGGTVGLHVGPDRATWFDNLRVERL